MLQVERAHPTPPPDATYQRGCHDDRRACTNPSSTAPSKRPAKLIWTPLAVAALAAAVIVVVLLTTGTSSDSHPAGPGTAAWTTAAPACHAPIYQVPPDPPCRPPLLTQKKAGHRPHRTVACLLYLVFGSIVDL